MESCCQNCHFPSLVIYFLRCKTSNFTLGYLRYSLSDFIEFLFLIQALTSRKVFADF